MHLFMRKMLKLREVSHKLSLLDVVATLSRLGSIAAENAVYVNKMKKRFRVMNIVGKEEERQASYDIFLLLTC